MKERIKFEININCAEETQHDNKMIYVEKNVNKDSLKKSLKNHKKQQTNIKNTAKI